MDNKPPKPQGLSPFATAALHRESWKIFQIMAEFVEGFRATGTHQPLGKHLRLRPLKAGSPLLCQCRNNRPFVIRCRLLRSQWRRPGHNGSRQQGCHGGQISPALASISSCPKSKFPTPIRTLSCISGTFFRARLCLSNTPPPMSYAPAVSAPWMNWQKCSPCCKPARAARYPSC